MSTLPFLPLWPMTLLPVALKASQNAMQQEHDASDFEVDMDTEEEATPLKKKSKCGPLLSPRSLITHCIHTRHQFVHSRRRS